MHLLVQVEDQVVELVVHQVLHKLHNLEHLRLLKDKVPHQMIKDKLKLQLRNKEVQLKLHKNNLLQLLFLRSI